MAGRIVVLPVLPDLDRLEEVARHMRSAMERMDHRAGPVLRGFHQQKRLSHPEAKSPSRANHAKLLFLLTSLPNRLPDRTSESEDLRVPRKCMVVRRRYSSGSDSGLVRLTPFHPEATQPSL